jgi:alpha-glucosidase
MTIRRFTWLCFILCVFWQCTIAQLRKGEPLLLKSPDESLKIQVTLKNKIYYSVYKDSAKVLAFSPISMTLSTGEVLGASPILKSSKIITHSEDLKPCWWTKNKIQDKYNELQLVFEGNYSLIFRAYDEGIGYRFVTNFKNPINIKNEEVQYNFNGWPMGFFPDDKTYETNYSYKALNDIDKSHLLYLPVLIETDKNIKVAISESDVLDYPSLLLQKSNDYFTNLVGYFKPYPLAFEKGGYDNFNQIAVKTADYVASTQGTRSFPWRVMIVSTDDKSLVDNDLIYKLASPQKISAVDWIKPGKAAWEWWDDYMIEGVDFVSGINTKSYLYRIDFAAQYHLDYIIIDWNWSNPFDLTLINPDVDIDKIVQYANTKGIKVIVWCTAYTLYNQLDKVLDLYASWGISGIKVDFFDRDDQLANQMYEKIALAAAKRKLVVDFHGCAKPSGLSRAYPNVLNFEAVKGLENTKWSNTITPEHNLILPFTRMLAGQMDYTPGAMRNSAKGKFVVVSPPMSQGTRCHQLAMYVVYFEPLAMLCDAPSSYQKEPEYTELLASIPTVWDETKVIEAKAGDYILMARRSGKDWYLAAMTDWTERDFAVNLSFLDKGIYIAQVAEDGVNADRFGSDYRMRKIEVTQSTVIPLHLAPGGGVLVKIVGK